MLRGESSLLRLLGRKFPSGGGTVRKYQVEKALGKEQMSATAAFFRLSSRGSLRPARGEAAGVIMQRPGRMLGWPPSPGTDAALGREEPPRGRQRPVSPAEGRPLDLPPPAKPWKRFRRSSG